MNEARFNSIMANASTVSKKVYDSVPVEGLWSKQEIHADLARRGAARDMRLTEGCLKSLKEQGVIEEPKPGHFVRSVIHRKRTPLPLKKKETPVAQHPVELHQLAPMPKSPVDILSGLAERARTLASNANKLATDIDDAALEIEGLIEQNSHKYSKLDQLSNLLREIHG